MLGDVVGEPGRIMFEKHVARLRQEYRADAVVVNGENSNTNGRGITPRIARFFHESGANVVTTGNHVWAVKDIYSYIADNPFLLRPANFPSGCPGKGVYTFNCNGQTVAVVNLQGRVFMRELVDCPFRAIDSILTFLKHKTKIILVDFHAETTAEKSCFAHYVDGRVSGVVGTHTHTQTADERVLPNGTAFITDLGMGGALNSSLGMKKEPIIQHFMTQMPIKFEVETQGPFIMCGVCIEVDVDTGNAVSIERIRVVDTEMVVSKEEE